MPVLHVKDFVYISKSFSFTYPELDDFFVANIDKSLVIDQWVLDNMHKHYINCWIVQKLDDNELNDILEVGGGISYFTHYLSKRANYLNLDVFSHFTTNEKFYMEKYQLNVIAEDWRTLDFQGIETCIAVDIFPNVDQGLRTFLQKIQTCKHVFLSFTVFEEEKHYRTKRVDGDEILTQVSWTLEQLKFSTREHINNIDILRKNTNLESPFRNSRDVFLVHLQHE